jgi:ABC-2 type transport system ATP-binding protein
VHGLDPAAARREVQRRVGYLSAGGTALYARLTAAQHLRLWARLAFVPREAIPRRAAAVIDEFGLRDILGRRMDRLSQGQRQRVRLALAFLPEPDLLLLDEPETSLDADGRQRLRGALDAARDRGAAAIWCAPDPPSRLRGCAAMALRDGRLHPA